MDLEQLREVLSMQGSPLDATTLLGVCDSIGLTLNYEPTLGVDSFNWSSNASQTAAWNRRSIPADSGLQSQTLAALLDQHLLPKVAKPRRFSSTPSASIPS